MHALIEIENLKCGGCATTITRSLAQLTGVSSVQVDKEKELVELELASETSLNAARQKLRELGYPEKNTVHGFSKLAAGAKSYVSCAIGRFGGEAQS